jgi:hypothetical protein
MEWIVHRMFDAGRLVPRLRLFLSPVVGRMVIAEQFEKERGRTVRVARILPSELRTSGPELLEPQLVGNWGEGWVLSGYEVTHHGGRFVDATMTAQSWILQPGPAEALQKAEHAYQRAVRELNELKGLAELQPGNPPRNLGSR